MSLVRALGSVVNHATMEWAHGAAPVHAIWEATLAGALVAHGLSPRHAIHAVERMERMGAVPGFEPRAVERMERAMMLSPLPGRHLSHWGEAGAMPMAGMWAPARDPLDP